MKVTCPACGSANLAHLARAIVRHPILSWEQDCDGNWRPDSFGDNPEVDMDSLDSVDLPFHCLDCLETEMTESELLYDGKPHPDADEADEEEEEE